MARFGLGLIATRSAGELVDLVRTAEQLGFDFCNLSDDPSARDPYAVVAAAATVTSTIRLGFSATHVYLRDPTLIAQSLATIDELSGGRVEAVVSFGDPSILDTYHVEWRGRRPLDRVREAIEVMRAYLDDGVVDHQGASFRYSGLQAGVRPIQAHVPLFVGALGGPRSFELAGEVADGVQCGSTSAENSAYVVDHVRAGAKRAGRDPDTLQMGAYCFIAVSADGTAAVEAARRMTAGLLGSYPESMILRHGLDPAQVAPITAALEDGDMARALELTTPEIGEALTIAGTPEVCAERIRTDLVEPGIDHVQLAILEPAAVEADTGSRVDGLPDIRRQLQLVHDGVIAAV
ncbi:LLM class flavin-dependent oxidoreductase [Nitriliruptor alkaliphilus]|uniref:LLM class flavin-dependent oxidoreductase n=1 Tax=Nitriliruptor alkaliphilus TaxID=427918 RepID=UPI000695B72B|nr:LLM class flavin-dependent oxidoreductase [Nitriliruptor alkaliphilus]